MVVPQLPLLLVLFSAVPLHAFYIPGWSERSYADGQRIPLQVNKITSDATELPYSYSELPFICKPKHSVKNVGLNLGEVLRGDRIVESDYELTMGKTDACRYLCDIEIGKDELLEAQRLIRHNYVVEWIVDNLPGATSFKSVDKLRKYYAAGFKLGNFENDKIYLHNHVTLILRYRKTSKDPNKKLIIGFEVYPKSINGPEGKCPVSISDANQSPLELTLPTDPARSTESKLEYDPTAKLRITYTYSVYWEEDDSIEWHNRWDLYFVHQEQSSNIHVLAIINSLVISFLLSGMVGVVLLRTLNRDIQSYNAKISGEDGKIMKRLSTVSEETLGDGGIPSGEDDDLLEDATGWKLVHGDVFRPPPFGGVLAPLVGSGVQLLVTVFSLLVFSIIGVLNPSYRGGFVSFGLFLFVFAGLFSGYFSSRVYKAFGGENWVKNAALTSLLVPGCIFLAIFVLNLFVWAQASSSAIPFFTLVALVSMWLLISVPLVVLGSWFGFKRPAYDQPTKTTQIPRQIPQQPWYIQLIPSVLLGGIVPFAVIFIELLFVFKSIWQDKSGYYYMFGFLALIIAILLVTIVEITVVVTYFQLCAENYHWWWHSFRIGASSCVYIFLYSVWYYFTKLHIQGFVNSLLFFGYSFLGSAVYGVLGGTVGFLSAYMFVRRIYGAVKAD
ncbi:hypothetical protein H072_2845 [Dactylellina haptotyla CBS 200.50]|uniref:Transmembrane 9 superfamily member n=1 Tax=Dactylellina haptotyla (strain CBS 200.50) TaxID=1284197 RepID=S8AJU5_DACHA|nr:hypothetical protein H072_2845 [Dactylellina haptotyla CBS 200.50]